MGVQKRFRVAANLNKTSQIVPEAPKTKLVMSQAHESRQISLSTHACVRLSSAYG